MPSTLPSGPRSLVLRVLAILAGIAWVTVLFAVAFTHDEDPVPPVVIEPVESYDSDDLARLADELALLRGTRLTPQERSVVGQAADVVDALSSGDAVIAPGTTQPVATSTSTTRPTTTTTTAPPPTTAPAPRRSYGQMVTDLADQLGVEIPDAAGG